MTTVQELRKELHGKLRDTEPIKFGEIEKVNTFSRMELMKEKTRELMRRVSAGAKPSDGNIHKAMGEFDMLAIDWVYSNRIEWEDSLPDKKAKKIVGRLAAETR